MHIPPSNASRPSDFSDPAGKREEKPGAPAEIRGSFGGSAGKHRSTDRNFFPSAGDRDHGGGGGKNRCGKPGGGVSRICLNSRSPQASAFGGHSEISRVA